MQCVDMNRLAIFGTVLLLGFALPIPVLAYIGPGAGLSAIGTVVAVAGAFLLLIVGFVWYPVKRMIRGRKSAAEDTAMREATEDAAERESTADTTEKQPAKSER